MFPERGHGAAVTPFAVTERIDERSPGRAGGDILLVELGGELGEILIVAARNGIPSFLLRE